MTYWAQQAAEKGDPAGSTIIGLSLQQGAARRRAAVLLQDGDERLSQGRRGRRLPRDDEYRRALLQRRRRAPGPRARPDLVPEGRGVSGEGPRLESREGGPVPPAGGHRAPPRRSGS